MSPHDHPWARASVTTPELSGAADESETHDLDAVETLLRIASLAREFNDERIGSDAASTAERIGEGRFYVACVGQFKRGKSTLLNALIGEPVLPSGVLPVTSVPTVLRYGSMRRARVRAGDSTWVNIPIRAIEDYVSEAKNPENTKGVTGLEIFVPSPLLETGMCLVDTPGIGSVFGANTAATHAFVPHIDAAIVAIGADPPIAGDELSLIKEVGQHVPQILYVLNKADRVDQHDRREAVSFAKHILKESLNHDAPSVYEVSALEQLNGVSGRDWECFVERLQLLANTSGQSLVQEAGRRSIKRLCRQLLSVISEERSALIRPFEESEHRINELRAVVAKAEQALGDLSLLFAGEQQRLSKQFRERRDRFLEEVRQSVHEELSSEIEHLPKGYGPNYRRSVMRTAQDVARSRTTPWLRIEQEFGQEAYGGVTVRFVEMTNEFLSNAQTICGEEFSYLPKEIDPQQTFRIRSEFSFLDYITLAQPASPLRYLGDVLLGCVRAHSVMEKEAHEFLDLLIDTNTERIRNDLENRVSQSRRRLESDIKSLLRQLTVIAERALDRARKTKSEGAASVERWADKLSSIESEVQSLMRSML